MTLTVTNYVDRYSKESLRRITQRLVSREAIIHLKEETERILRSARRARTHTQTEKQEPTYRRFLRKF